MRRAPGMHAMRLGVVCVTFMVLSTALSSAQDSFSQDLLQFLRQRPEADKARDTFLAQAVADARVVLTYSGKNQDMTQARSTRVLVRPASTLKVEFDMGEDFMSLAQAAGVGGLSAVLSQVRVSSISPVTGERVQSLVFVQNPNVDQGEEQLSASWEQAEIDPFDPKVIDWNDIVDQRSLLQVELKFRDTAQTTAKYYAKYFRLFSASLVGLTGYYQTDTVRLAAIQGVDDVITPSNLSAGLWLVNLRFGMRNLGPSFSSFSFQLPIVYTILENPGLGLRSAVGIGAGISFVDKYAVAVGLDFFNTAANNGHPIVQFMIGVALTKALITVAARSSAE